jgi:hypothetical protein
MLLLSQGSKASFWQNWDQMAHVLLLEAAREETMPILAAACSRHKSLRKASLALVVLCAKSQPVGLSWQLLDSVTAEPRFRYELGVHAESGLLYFTIE